MRKVPSEEIQKNLKDDLQMIRWGEWLVQPLFPNRARLWIYFYRGQALPLFCHEMTFDHQTFIAIEHRGPVDLPDDCLKLMNVLAVELDLAAFLPVQTSFSMKVLCLLDLNPTRLRGLRPLFSLSNPSPKTFLERCSRGRATWRVYFSPWKMLCHAGKSWSLGGHDLMITPKEIKRLREEEREVVFKNHELLLELMSIPIFLSGEFRCWKVDRFFSGIDLYPHQLHPSKNLSKAITVIMNFLFREESCMTSSIVRLKGRRCWKAFVWWAWCLSRKWSNEILCNQSWKKVSGSD